MDIPKEILAYFEVKEKLGGIDNEEKKNKTTAVATKPKRKMGETSGTHRKITDEEWEAYKRNAKSIGNPLSKRQAAERKNARIALAEKYSDKKASRRRAHRRNKAKSNSEVKTIIHRRPVIRIGAYSYGRSKNREREYGRRKTMSMAKCLLRTFPNIFDREAVK